MKPRCFLAAILLLFLPAVFCLNTAATTAQIRTDIRQQVGDSADNGESTSLVCFREARVPEDLEALSAQRMGELMNTGENAGLYKTLLTCEGLRTGRSVGVVGEDTVTGRIVASADISIGSKMTVFPIFGGNRKNDIGRVKNVLVSREERTKGLGRFVMNEMESLAASRGLTALEVEVVTSNTPAVNLYRSLGYVPRGVDVAMEALGSLFSLQILLCKDLDTGAQVRAQVGAATVAKKKAQLGEICSQSKSIEKLQKQINEKLEEKAIL